MIVAVRGVRVVEMAAHEIIHMRAVRDGGVTAGCTVRVAGGVRGAGVIRRAVGRVRGADFERVFIRVARVTVMQMAVVRVVGVALVEQGGVAAGGAVGVRLGVLRMMRAGNAEGSDSGESEAGFEVGHKFLFLISRQN